MDNRSRFGSWTSEVLEIIDTTPGLKAQEIADQLKVDKDWLKVNIRKLKNLGLTISLEVGYKISTRGKCFLCKMNS